VSSSPAASAASRRFAVRHVQLVRAALAALAAVMITFSPDHSAAVGLAVFSGFGIATALVLGAAVWLTYPKGRRAPVVLLALITLIAGMVTGIGAWRVDAMFFGAVISWAALAGIVELVSGILARRRAADLQERSEARDGIVVGSLGILLAIALALVPAGYRLDYVIDDAGAFELTAITIGVGIFGFYAAIVAVYLGIAGFSPRKASAPDAALPAREDAA
jgi:hypothetical protein